MGFAHCLAVSAATSFAEAVSAFAAAASFFFSSPIHDRAIHMIGA
jgi:hypothetical protein